MAATITWNSLFQELNPRDIREAQHPRTTQPDEVNALARKMRRTAQLLDKCSEALPHRWCDLNEQDQQVVRDITYSMLNDLEKPQTLADKVFSFPAKVRMVLLVIRGGEEALAHFVMSREQLHRALESYFDIALNVFEHNSEHHQRELATVLDEIDLDKSSAMTANEFGNWIDDISDHALR